MRTELRQGTTTLRHEIDLAFQMTIATSANRVLGHFPDGAAPWSRGIIGPVAGRGAPWPASARIVSAASMARLHHATGPEVGDAHST